MEKQKRKPSRAKQPSAQTLPTTKKSEKVGKINYDEHWRGMPEFTREDLQPMKQLIVNFNSKEDMLRFSKLVGQIITARTKSIYFPQVHETLYTDKRWADKKSKRKAK